MGVFDEVKERVTAREVMERAGIVFNRNNMCRCPFHQDKTASMKVKPTDKKYFCFGCGEKGDAIDFVIYEKTHNMTPESMEKIDERYVEAVQNREKVEFQLDTLLWGTEDEKEAVIHDLGKGVEDIERRVREYRRNQGTVNHNRQRSCEAVH